MRPYINNVYRVEWSVTVFQVLTCSNGDSKLELDNVEFSKINKDTFSPIGPTMSMEEVL